MGSTGTSAADSLQITTRIGCRNACAYCPQALLVGTYARRSRESVLSLEDFRACVDKVPTDVSIHFSGMSEPWLNPDCTRMAEYAHERGHELHVFTTAVGMSPCDVDALSHLSFAEFVVHLPSAEGYERIVIDECYLSVIGLLADRGMVTYWLCHGRAVHPLVKPVMGGKAGFVPVHSRAGNLRTGDSEAPRRRRGRLACTRGLHNNVLLPDGDVLLCDMDYGMRHILGNLRDHGYASLFSSAAYSLAQRGLEDESLDTLCRTCLRARRTDPAHRAWERMGSELRADEDSMSRVARLRLASRHEGRRPYGRRPS